jgi:DNA replication and repair protein RecF
LTSTHPLAIERITLDGYRNYRSLDLRLSPSFNVLAGQNGQGKTNLLEAIYLLSTTRILRGQRDAEAITEGADRFHVEAEVAVTSTRIAVAMERGGRKRSLLNGVALPRASDLIGRLPSVIVSSVDMAIVRGEPADRRLFLDLELSGLYPGYLQHFAHYKRALEQRNALLRQAREVSIPGAVFEPWEEQLATHGAAMRAIRSRYVTDLRPIMERVHARIGAGEAVEVGYALKDPGIEGEALLEALQAQRGADVARGSTSQGPHRDDLQIDIAGREARLYGSQGQQRTAVIALKLATLEAAKGLLGFPPVLLLDDIFSDLDENRRALLVDVVLENAGQVVVTCTEASAAGPRVLDQAQVFHVKAGSIQKEDPA